MDFPPPSAASAEGGERAPELRAGESYREARARFDAWFERQFVASVLSRHGGNFSAAARDVRMDRTHLMDLARKHGLDRQRRS